ncbi:MAG: serine hydrolase, partial [Halobacteriovoraceae bacterium]|nr:serine hydrolase [Halobacteriovoraceae bacterium]
SKKEIRMRDLLQMSSGIFWNEFYEGNPFQSHVVKMLYLSQRKDMAAFTASQRMRDQPGQYFNYSSGETNLLMGILKETFEAEEEYLNFPWTMLFNPLGMTNVTWERDGNNVFVGSSYLYMKPRDLARLGRLYLKEGKWMGEQLVPKQYVLNSLKASPASCQNNRSGSMRKFTYGYQWWLNQKCPEKGIQSVPKVDESIFMALGHHGQTMAVFPKHELIAVRVGADKRKRFNRDAWLQSISQTLERLEGNQ